MRVGDLKQLFYSEVYEIRIDTQRSLDDVMTVIAHRLAAIERRFDEVVQKLETEEKEGAKQ